MHPLRNNMKFSQLATLSARLAIILIATSIISMHRPTADDSDELKKIRSNKLTPENPTIQ